jgi:serine/threonine protein kinase
MTAPEKPSAVDPLASEAPGTALPNTDPVIPVSDVAVPERIGRYRVERVLGQGGFGCVYLGHDDELNRPVAIKVPHAHRVSRLLDVEAYLAEARVLASLDHAHIVPVFDVGRTDDGLCFVVSKYIEGSDLAEWIRQARPSFDESAGLVAAIAEALHHAHRKGLVHRDVKPGNIFIDATGKPYLGDFGLVLREEDFGTGPGFAGTLLYMSPEQASGEGHRVDGRSDIFSLGVILYELLTGRRPFRGDIRDEVLEQIISVEARPPRQIDDAIPKELERICLKALAKRVSERYTTAKDMAGDLRCFLAVQIAASVPVSAGSGINLSQGSVAGATGDPARVSVATHQSRSLVFVSYSRENEDLVLPLVRLLKASGQQVFVDVQDLEYGEDRKIQVAEAIQQSRRFLLFWSRSSQSSPLVREEWQLALATKGCGIVPVVLDQTPLPAELEGFHGTADLAPLFHVLERRKAMRRWLWLSWSVLAAILAFAVAGMLHSLGPIEILQELLFLLPIWLVSLLLPTLIFRLGWGLLSRWTYRELANCLAIPEKLDSRRLRVVSAVAGTPAAMATLLFLVSLLALPVCMLLVVVIAAAGPVGWAAFLLALGIGLLILLRPRR